MSRASIPAIEESLASGTFAARPHEMYRRLREQAPVYWSAFLGQWLVTSHQLVEEVLLQPTLFSSFGFDTGYISQLEDEELADVPTLNHHFHQRGLIQADPPEHTRLRRAVSRYFTTKAMAQLESQIRTAVSELLDAVANGFDVIRDLAGPLPVRVIADLLGVPTDDRSGFPHWSSDAVRFFGTPIPDATNARRLDGDLVEWRDLLRSLLAERRLQPRDDLLSRISELVDEGTVTLEEAIFTCVHLLIAGHETTTNLTGNALLYLLAEPDRKEEVLASPSLLANALEETLRFEPPIQRVRRMAAAPCDLAGAEIEEGDPVIPVLSAANRDPERFDRPDEFDLHRDFANRPHVAFGRGVHFCIGAPLARLEAPLAVAAVLERFPEASLPPDFEPHWRPTINLRGLTTLPISVSSPP